MIQRVSTWFSGKVLDLIDMLVDAYYTRKYGAMARRLGRPGVTPGERPGFIIIQIDGLSYERLIQAVAAGDLPYVGRMLAERRLTVAPWRCGLPSATPAVQAGIMFGNRYDIPGFRWYEKDRGVGMLARLPEPMRLVRARVSEGRKGILRGGSCYVSAFDGGADLALFTLSVLHRQRFFEGVRGLGAFLLFLLSPFRILRVAWLVGRSYVAALARRLVALVRPSVLNPFDVVTPFLQALTETLFTEVQTFGIMLDIYRCAPSIYANYTVYDDVAHKAGLEHTHALRALRGIDQRIHQIDRMRALYRRQQYDLYIISDHGNTPSVPFRWRNDASLGQYIDEQIGEQRMVEERLDGGRHLVERASYLSAELESLEQKHPRLRRMLAAFRRYVNRRVLSDGDLDYDLERRRDVVISASGPLAHVYFNLSPRPLDLIEVVLLYPHLLDTLLATPGVAALVGRARERTLVLGSGGGTLTIKHDSEQVEGPHPLEQFGDVAYAADQLHYLTHFPHSGDVIVLGAMEPDGRVVTFEDQVATHGGLGGAQMRPFVAWPPGCPLSPESLSDPVDLYSYFMQRYAGRSGEGDGWSTVDQPARDHVERGVVVEAIE
jgi:hypothetical protein